MAEPPSCPGSRPGCGTTSRDADTGGRADVAAGIRIETATRGFSVDVAARRLVAHSTEDFEQWGMSATGSWQSNPSSNEGVSIRAGRRLGLKPSTSVATGFEQAQSAATATRPMDASVEGEADYGIQSFSDRLTSTPPRGHVRLARGRDLTLRYRLSREARARERRRFELSLAETEHQQVDETPRRRTATAAITMMW